MDTPERDAARAECAKAYYAMTEADRLYSAALQKRYGKEAGDIRYQPKNQEPEIRALGDKMKETAEIWRNAFNAIPA